MSNRYNGKCKGCKKGHTSLLTRVENVRTATCWEYAWRSELGELITSDSSGPRGLGPSITCSCGKRIELVRVRATYNPEKECNAKCLSACGMHCECACGGKNHGAGLCAH